MTSSQSVARSAGGATEPDAPLAPPEQPARFGILGAFASRLSWRIAAVTFLVLIAIEIAMYFPARARYEAELLDQIRATGEAAFGPLLGPAAVQLDAALFHTIQYVPVVKGGRVCEKEGRCLRSFGEKAQLFSSQDEEDPAVLVRRSADGARLEVKWPSSADRNGSGRVVIARLDAASVDDRLANFSQTWVLASILGASILTTIAVMAAIGPLVLRPLLALRASILAANLDPERPERHMLATRRRDEIGDTIRASNHAIESRWRQLVRLLDTKAELARMLEEAKITARELEFARDEAKIADQAKSQFLANMSHELRTPLNAIIGFSDVLKSEQLGPIGDRRYVEFVGDIKQSGERLLRIVNDLLDMAKIDAGRLELNDDWVELAALLDPIAAEAETRARAQGLAFAYRNGARGVEVLADAQRLSQVVTGVLDNAVKFTAAGRVEFAVAGAGEGALEILVTDTGPGMSAGEIEAALQPFRQIEDSLTRSREGAGLGMSLARGIVELHGGKFAVRSGTGHGTQIVIHLPATRVRSAALEPAPPRAAAGA